MKKIVMLVAMAVISLSAFAQNWYVGGTLNAWRESSGNKTEVTIKPEVGYNFNQTWSLGGAIGWQYNYNDGFKTNVFAISPYVRATYARVGIVSFFVDGGFTYGLGKTKHGDLSSKTVNMWEVGFRPGLSVNINEHVGILAHVGFLGYRTANKAGKAAGLPEGGGLKLSSSDLNFGFYYNF